MTHYRRALDVSRSTQGKINAAFARGELSPGEAADATLLLRQGPDRTPLVVRVIFGLAIVAMVTLIVVGAYVGLALLLAKTHPGVR